MTPGEQAERAARPRNRAGALLRQGCLRTRSRHGESWCAQAAIGKRRFVFERKIIRTTVIECLLSKTSIFSEKRWRNSTILMGQEDLLRSEICVRITDSIGRGRGRVGVYTTDDACAVQVV